MENNSVLKSENYADHTSLRYLSRVEPWRVASPEDITQFIYTKVYTKFYLMKVIEHPLVA